MPRSFLAAGSLAIPMVTARIPQERRSPVWQMLQGESEDRINHHASYGQQDERTDYTIYSQKQAQADYSQGEIHVEFTTKMTARAACPRNAVRRSGVVELLAIGCRSHADRRHHGGEPQRKGIHTLDSECRRFSKRGKQPPRQERIALKMSDAKALQAICRRFPKWLEAVA